MELGVQIVKVIKFEILNWQHAHSCPPQVEEFSFGIAFPSVANHIHSGRNVLIPNSITTDNIL